jgi:tRNA (guanosine-2'-O-)-methyltransferase
MTTHQKTEKLRPFVPENKQKLIETKLGKRTRYFTVLLEDVYKAQNASAVMRTCECLGVQDLYVVEKYHRLSTYGNVELGSSKWISLKRYRDDDGKSVKDCVVDLRRKGYRICATYLREGTLPIQEYQIDGPTCFVFGTEQEGISDYVKEHADDLIHIPMVGFTDSLNLSVSVGIILQAAFDKIASLDCNLGLSDIEKEELRLEWYKRIVKGSEKILELD